MDAERSIMVPISRIEIPEGRRRAGDVTSLADSIREVGLLNPITVTEAFRLIAGRNRIEAFRALGRTEIPAFIKALSGLHAELAEIDENLCRNELTVLERGEQLARRKTIYEALHPAAKHGGDRKSSAAKSSGNDFHSFADDTAAKTNVTARTVRQEVQIAEKIAEPVKELIRDTELADTKTELLALAQIKDEETQKAVAEKIVSGEAKNVREAKIQHRDETAAPPPPLPNDGKYDVIYADPPWRYEHVVDSNDAIENQYPTMALDDICALPVSGLAAENCVLFLWTTAPKLEEAFSVLRSWGFTYRTGIVWVKSGLGMGHWARINHEHLLIAIRGTPKTPEPSVRPVSVIEEPKGRHSEKPVVFAELIEKAFPSTRRIELFCRSPREGWDSWGNEACQ